MNLMIRNRSTVLMTMTLLKGASYFLRQGKLMYYVEAKRMSENFKTDKEVKAHIQKVRQKIKNKKEERELLRELKFHQILEAKRF